MKVINTEAVVDTLKESVESGSGVREYTAEEISAREELYSLASEILDSYKLDWTFRSINYIVNKENITFNQLRSCTFKDGQDVKQDYIKAVLFLVKAGLVGSHQVEEANTEELDNRAYDIIEDWRNKFGYLGTLHILIINKLEKHHFFMGMQDLGVMEYLGYKNSQKDLAMAALTQDLMERVQQTQALS